MCDNNVACAKECLNHVTQDVAADDLTKWQQCTYSNTCAEIHSYQMKESCADECLEDHKRVLRQEAEQQRRAEEARRKEAEALMSGSAVPTATLLATTIAFVMALLMT